MTPASIHSRFAISFAANVARAALSLIAGLVVARSLGPTEYGSFAFLASTFVAMRQLLDMGASNAFYTVICRQPRGPRFYTAYAAWLAVQLLVPLTLIALVMPERLFQLLWVGESRGIVILALAATYIQQQIWPTVVQVAESRRLTHIAQGMGGMVAATHLALIAMLVTLQKLSVTALFMLLALEYLVASVVTVRMLPAPAQSAAPWPGVCAVVREFWEYCRPLVAYSWLGFVYTFADAWLLQRFGGAVEQAYFATSNQLVAVATIGTASFLQIFWKEVAERMQHDEHEAARRLFVQATQWLLFGTSLIVALLLPWAREIVAVLLGTSYVPGWPVLAVLLFYAIHQAMGQLVGTLFLATSRTRPQVVIGSVAMLAGIPLVYLLVAPADGAAPGLGLAGLGLALKMVGLQLVTVNVLWWWICRALGWRYEWRRQLVAPASALLVSLATSTLARALWTESSLLNVALVCASSLAAVAAISMIARIWPRTVGLERDAVNGASAWIRALLSRHPRAA
jgi:O-antigen/teichoic acid export membrane protein